MAGYQRFVAYVYEYRKGKKDGSSGYVRVEARGQVCRIDVHLRCAGLEPGSRCRVYGFVRQEGLMDGILIGSCVTGREQIECVLETDAENVGDMGKSLQELGGMLLISDAGGFWGTEWDDQPIRPENFREWKKEKPEKEKGEGEAKIMTAEEVQEDAAGDCTDPERKEPEKAVQEDSSDMASETLRTADAGKPQLDQPHPGPKQPEPPRPEQPHPEPRPPKPPKPAPGIPYDPFNDGQFTECRKIKPSDCGTLCRKNGCFCNNRFVIYGYQNFGHLLLCRNQRGQYILGVPGSYSHQERFMANMFGFPYFRESPEIRIPGGRGGYWYCFIDI